MFLEGGFCVFLFSHLESLVREIQTHDSPRTNGLGVHQPSSGPEASMPMFPTFAVLVNGFAGSFHDNGSFDDGQSSPGSQLFVFFWSQKCV